MRIARLAWAIMAAGILVSGIAPPALAAADAQDRIMRASDEGARIYDKLRGGGLVFVLRHGKSPHGQVAAVGMSAGCVLASGRGLSADGFAEARALGRVLGEENIPVLKAYTSEMCRSWDTARLVAGGAPVASHPSQKATDPAVIAAFKRVVEAELAAIPAASIMLVSHSNVAPLFGAAVCPGEEELPEGVLSVVSPESWETIVRILPDGDITSCNRAVD